MPGNFQDYGTHSIKKTCTLRYFVYRDVLQKSQVSQITIKKTVINYVVGRQCGKIQKPNLTTEKLTIL